MSTERHTHTHTQEEVCRRRHSVSSERCEWFSKAAVFVCEWDYPSFPFASMRSSNSSIGLRPSLSSSSSAAAPSVVSRLRLP